MMLCVFVNFTKANNDPSFCAIVDGIHVSITLDKAKVARKARSSRLAP